MDNPLFISSMAYLQKIYGKTIDDEVIAIYWQHLEKLTNEQFKAAMASLCASFVPTSTVPFPLIPHFLKAIGQDDETKAVDMVRIVRNAAEGLGAYETVNFHDPALHATINRFGGWVEVCSWDEERWEMNTRNFIAAYKSAKAAGAYAPQLVGIHEATNKFNGFSPQKLIEMGIDPKTAGFSGNKELMNDCKDIYKSLEPQKQEA